MDFRITEVNGVFSVFGSLNCKNINKLQDKIVYYLQHQSRAIINLSSIVQMDNTSAIVLQKLYTNAIRRNLNLLIMGRENKVVCNVMDQMSTTYILGENPFQYS